MYCFEAKLVFNQAKSSSISGKKNNAYRPLFSFNNVTGLYSGLLEIQEGHIIEPLTEYSDILVKLYFYDKAKQGDLFEGQFFDMYEGVCHVGEGCVTKIMLP